MIHFRKPPEKKQLIGKPLIKFEYPFINRKVVKETAFGSAYSEDIVDDVLKHWQDFLNEKIEEGQKVKIPYTGSLQPRVRFRELNDEIQYDINDDQFEELELK